jgi:hypothetical protein
VGKRESGGEDQGAHASLCQWTADSVLGRRDVRGRSMYGLVRFHEDMPR